MIIQQAKYDGSLIHQRMAYRFFRDGVSPYGNIIAFRAPMEVTVNLIDQEDVLNKDYIFSKDALNFCWEIPNLCAFGAVAFQRLFNAQIANMLYRYIQKPIEVDGDDLIIHAEFVDKDGVLQPKGKTSVSIAHTVGTTALGHTAINIVAGEHAPNFAYSTNLSDEQAQKFLQEVCDAFYVLVKDIFVATAKV